MTYNIYRHGAISQATHTNVRALQVCAQLRRQIHKVNLFQQPDANPLTPFQDCETGTRYHGEILGTHTANTHSDLSCLVKQGFMGHAWRYDYPLWRDLIQNWCGYIALAGLSSLTHSAWDTRNSNNALAHTLQFVFFNQRNCQDSTHQLAPLFNSGTGRNQMGSP